MKDMSAAHLKTTEDVTLGVGERLALLEDN